MTGPDAWPFLWAAAAEPLGVSPVVHPDDLLWTFVLGHPAFPEPADAAEYYFADGAESARKLACIVADHVRAEPHSRPRLLEFASGYGMVSRHLPRAIPEVEVLSCDIHPAAVRFIRDELGGAAVLSEHEPTRMAMPTIEQSGTIGLSR